MKRRHALLALAGGIVAPTMLPGCSLISRKMGSASASFSAPPSSTAMPIDFAKEQLWPKLLGFDKRICGMRGCHLVGSLPAPHTDTRDDSGGIDLNNLQSTVIVDLAEQTTRMLVLDPDTGEYATTTVDDRSTPSAIHEGAGTILLASAPVLDDEHAYAMVVRMPYPQPTTTVNGTSMRDFSAPLDVVAIRLSDGAITATATLSERIWVYPHTPNNVFPYDRYLCLTEEGSLFAWASDQGRMGETVARTLNLSDLSTILDAGSLTSETIRGLSPHAVVWYSRIDEESGRTCTGLISMDNGAHHKVNEDLNLYEVYGRWAIATGNGPDAKADDPPRVISLDTGEVVALAEDDPANAHSQDSQENIYTHCSESWRIATGNNLLDVRRPESSEPIIHMVREDSYSTSTAVYNDVLYLFELRNSMDDSYRLTAFDLLTGEQINETRIAGTGLESDISINAYGMHDRFEFIPATSWARDVNEWKQR